MTSQEELQATLALLALEEAEERTLYEKRILQTPLPTRVQNGSTWYPVNLTGEEFGPAGSRYLEVKRHLTPNAPPSAFSTGQVVVLFNLQPTGRQLSLQGIVGEAKPDRLRIAVPAAELPHWLYEGSLGVNSHYDDRSYREMRAALQAVQAAQGTRLAELREILLGKMPASFNAEGAAGNEATTLNPSQQAAVQQVGQTKDAMLILGPPGTGKTTTLVAAIQATLNSEAQVLVCAASNTAVDVLAERLAMAGVAVVRLGHPVRVSPHLLSLTLDAKLAAHPLAGEVKRLRRQADSLRKKAAKFKRSFGKQQKTQRGEEFAEAKLLSKDADRLEAYLLQDVLAEAQAFVCTLTGVGHAVLEGKNFATLFIDEAAQALEPAAWIAIRRANRVIFAGDPYQLPPTVKNAQAAADGLGTSLAEKFYLRQTTLGVQAASLLSIQYRMHEAIMYYSNHYFYQGRLQAHPTVQQRGLGVLAGPVVEFVDTAGCGYEELLNPETLSTENQGEVVLLLQRLTEVLQSLPPAVVATMTIGIIAPYKGQVELLKNLLHAAAYLSALKPPISVRTVDGFQGQERDLIAISLVRSNLTGTIGFLSDYRRINVAMTRARKKLLIIGDSATLGGDAFFAGLVSHIQQQGGYRTAWELGPLMQA